MSDHICIYAKAPLPGHTKTRLGETIGHQAAADLSRAMLLDICDQALQVPETRVSLWHPPDSHHLDFEGLGLPIRDFFVQQGENLGMRMSTTFASLLATPEDRVVIVGSDCITHGQAGFKQALAALKYYRVVLQPAIDGGYVLVGQSCHLPQMFDNIPWGSERVMALTRKRLAHANVHYRELSETFDIDTAADLKHLGKFLDKNPRKHSKAWFNNFQKTHG